MLFILLLLVDNKLEGNIVVVFGDGVGNGTWLLLLLLLLPATAEDRPCWGGSWGVCCCDGATAVGNEVGGMGRVLEEMEVLLFCVVVAVDAGFGA